MKRLASTHKQPGLSDDERERLVGSLLERHLKDAETDAAAKRVTDVLSRFLTHSRAAREQLVDIPRERAEGQTILSYEAAVRKEERLKLERLHAIDGQFNELSRDVFHAKDAIYAHTPVNIPMLEALDLLEDSVRYWQSVLSAKLFRGATPSGTAGRDSEAGMVRRPLTTPGGEVLDRQLQVIILLAVASTIGLWFLVGPIAITCLIAPLIVWFVRHGKDGAIGGPPGRIAYKFCVSCKAQLPLDIQVGDLCPGCGKVIGDDMSV